MNITRSGSIYRIIASEHGYKAIENAKGVCDVGRLYLSALMWKSLPVIVNFLLVAFFLGFAALVYNLCNFWNVYLEEAPSCAGPMFPQEYKMCMMSAVDQKLGPLQAFTARVTLVILLLASVFLAVVVALDLGAAIMSVLVPVVLWLLYGSYVFLKGTLYYLGLLRLYRAALAALGRAGKAIGGRVGSGLELLAAFGKSAYDKVCPRVIISD